MVDEAAQTQWRVIRLRRTETAFLTQLIDQIREEQPELDEDEAIAQAFLAKEYAPKMRLYLRYQTSIERAHAKAVTELEKAVKQRRQNEIDDANAEAAKLAMTPVNRTPPQPKPNPQLTQNGFVSQNSPAAPCGQAPPVLR